MTEKQSTPSEQTSPSNGEHPAEDARQQVEEKAGDVAANYDRARRELQEVVQSLRQEIARLDLEQARLRARNWVDENPTLAVFLGIGAGMLAGKLLASALKPAPPPPWHRRALDRADGLAEQAKGFAAGVGAILAEQAALAGRRAYEAGDALSRQAGHTADVVSRKARTVGGEIARRAGELADAASDTADRSAHLLHETAGDVRKNLRKKSKKAKKKARHAFDFGDTVRNAAGTAVAAVVIKKVNDWVRQLT